MIRVNTVEKGSTADYHFPSRKSARAWIRRNIRRGYVLEAVIFHFAGRIPLAAWVAGGERGFTYIPQSELLS